MQAYENLGRLQHGRGNLSGAIEYLERGLSIAEQTGKREEEARLRHRYPILNPILIRLSTVNPNARIIQIQIFTASNG